MRKFEKSVKLNNVCYDIRGPVMDEANRMSAAGEKILKLNIGNPAPFGFRAPDEIIKVMTNNLEKTEGYSDSKGIVSAREAIVEYDKTKNIPNVTVDDVYTGNGVSELISMAMQGLLNNGDEILIPAPDYPLWTATAKLAGGNPVHYICDEKSNWYPDIEDIKKKVNKKTKGIVIINPNNPQGLLDYGDEILVPAPDYPLWTASVTLAGGTAVHYICDEQANWYPDVKDIEKKITPRTKGIVIINPNNPTGALYPESVLKDIVKLAEKHDLIIFADEIYDRLVMDGKKHTSIASLTDHLCITFNGLSKSHLIAGYRVGWMSISGDKSNAKGYIEGIKLLSSMRLCSNVPAQSLIAPALSLLDETKKLVAPGGRVYQQRGCILLLS